MASARYPSLNSSKSRASSSFPILETKETISSTLKFWIISCYYYYYYLENVSKELLVWDSADASLLLSVSFKLIKERNRKIQIADSSEGCWLTVKHHESNAVALDLEDDKRIRAAEREALRVKTRTRATPKC